MSDTESKPNPLDKYTVTHYGESKGDDGHIHHEFDVYHGGAGAFGSFGNKHGEHIGRIYMSHPHDKPYEAKVTDSEIHRNRFHNKPEIHTHLEGEARKILANRADSKVVTKTNGQWNLT